MTDVPDSVACPCGNGYAERREETIKVRSRMKHGPVQETHVYRHKGCPIGGHVVEINDRIQRKAGPLFKDEPPVLKLTARIAEGQRLAADGGAPR